MAKEVIKDEFIPIPYPKENSKPVEWSHVLEIIDVCTTNHGIELCDDEGYNIIPI